MMQGMFRQIMACPASWFHVGLEIVSRRALCSFLTVGATMDAMDEGKHCVHTGGYTDTGSTGTSCPNTLHKCL